ncbi:hypothetical protein SAMN06272741_7155 [Streptomyces sp. 2114.4]|nr:hypothetical protein SAMN06272741_7155 [Streptomyces sp. 2114.4]
MSDGRRQQRLRLASIGLGMTAVAVVVLGTWQWPGWPAIASWLGTWWWTLTAIVALAGCGVSWASARRSTASPDMTPPVEWDQLPDGPGLIARATEPATSAAEPTAAEAPRQQMNWSAISSVVTTFTALAALVFTAQSLSATEQGQFTDRYTKAMDQIGTLGEEHLQTRLGAVYALERLARDSPPDQPTIVQVLSAFVRANLPQATPQAILLPSGALPPPPPHVRARARAVPVGRCGPALADFGCPGSADCSRSPGSQQGQRRGY